MTKKSGKELIMEWTRREP